jgi:hypothetical protein
MQGTVVMLMALSGLGCHNKSCDAIYAAPTYSCYGSGCYANVYPSYVAPSSYTGCYTGGYSGCYATNYAGCFGGGCYGGCYSSCYSSCYGGMYAGGHRGCGLLARLFGCCGWKHRSSYGYGGYGYGAFGDGNGYGMPYSPPIFGYALQFNYGEPPPGSVAPSTTPSEAAPPVPANPVVPSDSPPPPPSPSEPKPAMPAPGGTVTPPPRPTPADIPVPTPPKPGA